MIKLSKVLIERVKSITYENDLVDDCKYLLELNDGWKYADGWKTIPCKNKREIVKFLKECVPDE